MKILKLNPRQKKRLEELSTMTGDIARYYETKEFFEKEIATVITKYEKILDKILK